MHLPADVVVVARDERVVEPADAEQRAEQVGSGVHHRPAVRIRIRPRALGVRHIRGGGITLERDNADVVARASGRDVVIADRFLYTAEVLARFGRSLFGSSAAAGSMADQDELRQRTDGDGISLPDAIGAHGVDLDKALDFIAVGRR